MKYKIKLLTCVAIAAVVVTSCKRDYYDKVKYEEMISVQFPVVDVDGSHDWSTISECTANIGIDMGGNKTYTVRIYEGNPIRNLTGYVLVEGTVRDGASLTTNFSHPKTSTTFYVAITDGGTTYAIPLTADHGLLSKKITTADLATAESTQRSIYNTGFDMAYCFEDCYPQSGDYDFNDVVIGTNMTKTVDERQTTIALDMSIRAVGSTKTMAAALHIAGLKADDVKSVECTGPLFAYHPYGLGNFKDKDKNQMFPAEQPEKGYLVSRHRQSDIYIPLTNDVHYSLNRGKTAINGMVERLYYNSMLASQMPKPDEDGKKAPVVADDIEAVKGRIVITLNEGIGDKNITARSLDMFIMEEYNAAIWEVHTFSYKTRPVIFDSGVYEDNVFPWAIAVPGSSFRWPAEGLAIGTYKSTSVIGGAYQAIGHSFGQWAANKRTATDWYMHPTTIMVY